MDTISQPSYGNSATTDDMSVYSFETPRTTLSTTSFGTTISEGTSYVPESVINDPYPAAAGPRLPCEFAGYHSCGESYQPAHWDLWIRHCLEHYQGRIPVQVLCWYCDERFVSRSRHPTRLRENYAVRMEHIYHHIVNEGLNENMQRCDYGLVQHLYTNELITQQMYEHVRNEWTDRIRYPDNTYKPVPTTEGMYPLDYVPDTYKWSQERRDAKYVNPQEEDRRRRRERRHPRTK
jgi:hypothetical protein